MAGRRLVGGATTLAALVGVLVWSPIATVAPVAVAAVSPVVNTGEDAPDANPSDGICASTLPGGPCTLRAAVQTANHNPGYDAITFDPAFTDTGPPDAPCQVQAITLSVLGPEEDEAATGDLDVLGPLGISALCGVIISGGSGATDRVFDIFADTSLYEVDTQDGQGGLTAGGRGGSFLVHTPATLELVRSDIFDSSSEGMPGTFGGAIYGEAGTTIQIRNSILFNNHAGTGGGIWTAGRLEMLGFVGIVQRNTAVGDGGAIFLASGASAEIAGISQSDLNNAGGNGGFLYASAGSRATMWSNHILESTAALGGHLYIEDGATVGVVGTALADGVGDQGGSVYNAGELTITGSGFVGNGAFAGDGGAIYNDVSGRVEIQRSFGSGNAANQTLGDGGFLYNLGTAVVANTSITNSSAENEGAGVWTSGPLDLRFTAIANGIANTGPGAGLFVEPGTADVRLSHTVFADHAADPGNGPIDCSGEVTLVGTSIVEFGACTDSATQAGFGTVLTQPRTMTLSPAAGTFTGSGSQVPQLVTADAGLVDVASASECVVVAIDGYGNQRLGAGDTACDVGPVEAGGSPPAAAVGVRPDTVAELAPAFRSLALADLPPAAITGGLATGAATTTAASPLARIDFGQPLHGTEQVETTPLARIPLARIPLARIPLARIPLARIGLAQIPLARIPLARIANEPAAIDTWDEMVAGSLLANRPLSSTTLADVLDPANWPAGGLEDFIERFEALTLEQIDLTATVIGRMPVDALSVADVPLADLPLATTAPAPENPDVARVENLEAWCDYFASQGFACADFSIDPQQPSTSEDVNLTVVAMVGVPLARIPLARIPLARIPLARIPLLDTPLARIDYANTPLARIPLARIDLEPAPLARIPLAGDAAARDAFAASALGTVPLVGTFSLLPPGTVPESLGSRRLVDAVPSALAAVVDCSVIACTDPTSTVATAFASRDAAGLPNGIRPTATVGHLLAAYPSLTLGDIRPWAASEPSTLLSSFTDLQGLTINELFAAVLAPERDEITLGAVLNGFVARADVAWDGLDLGAPELAGIGPAAGSVTYSVAIRTPDDPVNSDILMIELPEGWKLAPGGVVDDGAVVDGSRIVTSGQTTEIEVDGSGGSSILRITFLTGLDAGEHEARFWLTAGTPDAPVAGAAAFPEVERTFEPNDTPAQAATAVGGTVINPDTLYVSTIDSAADVDLWPILVPRGYELSVALSGMTTDLDVVVYSPPGATEEPLIQLDGGLRQPPDRSLPFLPDFGLGLGRDDTRVQPERLQDIPLQPGRRVYAASLDRGATPERIDTPALGGGVYLIQVTGFNGASSTDPYGLRASVRPSLASTTCATTRPPLTNAPLPQFPAGPIGSTTLFVVNSARSIDTWTLEAADDVFAELSATVAAINDDVETGAGMYGGGAATVLDLATIGAVEDAYVSWDAGRCEPARANGVVKAIGAAIDQAVVDNDGIPFENVVLIGADDIIPMGRVVDGTTLGNEREYGRLFATNNELSSSLSFGIVLTDDPYGDARPVQIAGRELYVPELAVGRLVEQPAQIAAALEMYRTSFGVLDANTAAVTGYEFLTDGANAVRDALAESTGRQVSELISDQWTKADLEQVLGTPTGLLSINAHFDHNRALPADQSVSGVESDPVSATSLGDAGGRRLLFSMGCHAGLSVSDVSLGVAESDELRPDWAQQLAATGDLLVGNTGYGYGDTDIVAASEKLMTYFAQRLDGSVSIGRAMQLAKQRYSSDLPVITPYDEKVLQQVVMYGLPMYRVSSSPGPLPDRPDGVTPDGAPGGLQTTSFDVELGVGSDADPVTPDLVPQTIDRGTYWAVEEDPSNLLENTGRILTAQYRPVQPQYAIEVTDETVPAAEARGALITSLASTDIPNVNPVNFRPTVDLAANEPEPVVDDAAFPDRIQGLTSFSDVAGDRQQLILNVGQFLQNPAATNGSGTQRLFTEVGGTVYYVPASNPDRLPPTILRTDGTTSDAAPAQFEVEVTDDADVLRVVVLSTDVEDPGVWQTTELSLGGDGVWRGSTALPASGPSVMYFVQALDENGNVAVSSNKAVYYLAAPVDETAPTVSASTTPDAAFADEDVTVTISATDGEDGSGIASLTYVRDGVSNTVINTTGADPFTTSFVVTASGATTIAFSALDNRGNTSDAGTVTVSIDRQPATISTAISPPPNGSGWIAATAAAVEATAVDDGVAPGGALTYGSTGALTVPPGTAYPGAPVVVTAAGTSTLTFATVDAAGNAASASATVRLDPAAPTVAVVAPAEGATYTVGQAVLAAYTCADPAPGSGVATGGCVGAVPVGAAVATSTPGPKTFTVTATDVAGNTTVRTVGYTVQAAPTNVAPTIRADWGVGAADVGFFGDVARVEGSFADANGNGPWQLTVNWGNGRTSTSTRTATGAFVLTSPAYGRSGTFTVSVRVCDAAQLCASTNVTVRLRVPTSSLRATAVCVADGGPRVPLSVGRFTAQFSWRNSRAYWIYAPVGPSNAFLVLPADRGQPTLFAPGNSPTTVSAKFALLGTGWWLGDTIALATILTRRC